MILFPAGIDGSNMFPTLWFELFFEFTDLKLVEIIIILRRLLEEIASEISIYAVRSILLLLSSNQGCQAGGWRLCFFEIYQLSTFYQVRLLQRQSSSCESHLCVSEDYEYMLYLCSPTKVPQERLGERTLGEHKPQQRSPRRRLTSYNIRVQRPALTTDPYVFAYMHLFAAKVAYVRDGVRMVKLDTTDGTIACSDLHYIVTDLYFFLYVVQLNLHRTLRHCSICRLSQALKYFREAYCTVYSRCSQSPILAT